MKTSAVLPGVLLSLVLAFGQAHLAVSAATTPAKPAKPAAQEAPPKIPGVEIARPNGTYLGMEVVDGKFKLSFYDAKKKAMPADITRALVRWPNKRGPGDFRSPMSLSGEALVSAKPVQPPYVFNAYLTLLQGEGDAAEAVESYVVPFRG
jgi:hypothetical protein